MSDSDIRRELRVAIRYNTVQVPGLPHDRAKRVAEDFAQSKLHRQFRYGKDFIHFPSDFDCEIPKNVWILCDFNIREPLVQVEHVPLQCWKVQYKDANSALFTERSMNVKGFTDHYPWGGRENEWEYRIQQRKIVSTGEERLRDNSVSASTVEYHESIREEKLNCT